MVLLGLEVKWEWRCLLVVVIEEWGQIKGLDQKLIVVANLVKVIHQILLWQIVILVVVVLCKVIGFSCDFSGVKYPFRLLLLLVKHTILLGGLTRCLLVGSY